MFFFFFNDTATTEIYTLSLHDALPILKHRVQRSTALLRHRAGLPRAPARSEEHTSELQSPCNLVCRLLLEKKKKPHTPSSAFASATSPSSTPRLFRRLATLLSGCLLCM